ncbi:MAG: DUF2079 domain-containing protein [Clostridia bacterium]|nr:DUF2079 domain-containing protein [Clostridia bacterium]
MIDSVKNIFSRIYNRREPLILSAVCVWMTCIALMGFSVSARASLICALITAIPVLFSALALKGNTAVHVGRLLLFLSSLAVCARGVYEKKTDFYLFVCAAVFMAVVGVYCARSLAEVEFGCDSRLIWIPLAVCAALYFAAFNSAVTVSRYLAYRAPAFDFGIFTQIFYSLKEHFLPLTTCERGYELSHSAVHLSPVFYLALPIYALFPRPETVQIIQALALALGVIPLWLTAKRLGISNKVSALFSAVYLFHPALMGGCMYDFHENSFLPVMILWTVYFAEKNKLIPAIIFTVLTCSVKEDAAVYIAFLGLFLLFSGRRKVLGATITGVALAYFVCACAYLDAQGLGIMTWRYTHVSSDGTLTGVIVTAIKEPFRVIKECFSADKFQFAVMMLLPLGLLPFFTKKISRYILFGGLVLVNLMPNWQYQYSLDFQYVFGPLTLLVYASLINYSELAPAVRRSLAAFACTACVLAASARMPSQANYIKYLDELSEEIEVLDEAMTYVPDDAPVAATSFLLAHLAERDVVYEIGNTYDISDKMDDIEYIVIDLRYTEWDALPAKYAKLGYIPVFRDDNVVCVMKKSK